MWGNPPVLIIGNLSNDDGDFNENGKKTIGLGPVEIHTMPDKFKNGILFFWLRLPFTLIRTNPDKFSFESGTFRKRSPEWKNLNTPASRISVDGEHFENRTFQKRRHRDCHVTSLPESFSIINPIWLQLLQEMDTALDICQRYLGTRFDKIPNRHS